MKGLKKLLFVGCIPALAFTSCNTRAKIVTFAEAKEYVENNYDANAFDNLKSLYSIKINNIDIGLDLTIYSGEATSYVPFYLSLGGMMAQIEAPVVCFNSTLLGYIQGLWAQYSGISLKFLTDIGVKMEYTLTNGAFGCAVVSTAEDKITNAIESALAGLNAATKVPAVMAMLPDMVATIAQYGIGVAADSKGTGTIGLGIKTNNRGYINDIYFNIAADLDLNLATNSFDVESEFPIPEYNYNLKGHFELNLEICNDIK